MMPAAEAARRDLDPLDADVGPIFRLELHPVAIPLHVVVQVPGDESRRGETDPRRAESDARKHSEDCSSDDRGTQLLSQTKYAHRFHLSLISIACRPVSHALQCPNSIVGSKDG